MRLFNLLCEFMPANEAKVRLKSGRIKINNEVVQDMNIELPIQEGYWELGEFVYNHYVSLPKDLHWLFMLFDDIRYLFGETPSNVKIMRFYSGFTLITLSKREEFVFMNA